MIVFADTFAFLAWLNPRDQFHERVTRYLNRFTGRIVTTEWVLIEVADALSAPHARATTAAFIRSLRKDSMFDIQSYELAAYEAGFDLFSNRLDKEWSLTDCISFAVMANRGLVDALTEDHHFEQAGFHTLFGS